MLLKINRSARQSVGVEVRQNWATMSLGVAVKRRKRGDRGFASTNTDLADNRWAARRHRCAVRRSDAVGIRTHLAHREVTALELAQIGEKVARQRACRDRDLS